MATEDFSFSTKKKKADSYFKDSSNGKYSNLSLNRGYKYSEDCFGETKSSKFGLKNDRYKFSGAFNSLKEEKNKSLFDSDKSWKTSFQLKHELESGYSSVSKAKDNKKSKNVFDSRDRGSSLSDYIQKSMHLYESPVEEDEILTFKKGKKMVKDGAVKLLSPSSDLQDSWEFPRQQKEDPASEPEVMQFKASQKLISPSQKDESPSGQCRTGSLLSSRSPLQNDTIDVNAVVPLQKDACTNDQFVRKELGRGRFGAVYQCEDESGAKYAIKCVDAEAEIKMEKEILMKANESNVKHICQLIDYGEDNQKFFMIIDLLSPCFLYSEREFEEWSDEIQWKVFEQSLIALQNLHGLGYLHLDIHDQNFGMGLGKNQYMVYLIDFGMSMEIGSPPNEWGQHILNTSIAATEVKKLGPKDDLEDWFRMVLEIFRSALSWFDYFDDEETISIKRAFRDDESIKFARFFGNVKSLFNKENTNDTADKTFPELLKIMRYIDSLKAEDGPDYDKIFYFLHSAYEKAHQKGAIKFDMKMTKLKDDAVKSKELQKKCDEKDEEIRQLSLHCRSNVQPLENVAFFTGYDYDVEKYKTENNPKGKYYNEIELNGLKMTLKTVTDTGNWYENESSGIEIKIDGKQQQQLGAEAKILQEKKKNEK